MVVACYNKYKGKSGYSVWAITGKNKRYRFFNVSYKSEVSFFVILDDDYEKNHINLRVKHRKYKKFKFINKKVLDTELNIVNLQKGLFPAIEDDNCSNYCSNYLGMYRLDDCTFSAPEICMEEVKKLVPYLSKDILC